MMPSLFLKSGERSNSPYINHFIQPDTVVPQPSNPQNWNRYSYVVNNPIRYNDPDGHCAPVCVVPVIVGITAIVAVTAAYYVAVTPSAQEYISKRVLDRVEDFEQNVANTNNGNDGKNFANRGCFSSIKMAAICGAGALAVVKGLKDSIEKGGCGEEGSNVACPSTTGSTATSTVLPIPGLINLTPPAKIKQPKVTPMRVPIPPEVIWERRLRLKGLE